MKNKILSLSFSNIFVFLSLVWTFLFFFWFYSFFQNLLWNDIFSNFLKFFIFTFFHWGLLHFFSNAIFIIYFWNIVELSLWKTKYLLFFVFSVVFEWISILIFSDYYNVIWISWFCMAILAYYTLDLKYKNDPEYKSWIVFIALNIAIWLMPWISFLWHLFWMISWIIFYYLNKEFLRKKMVWAFS